MRGAAFFSLPRKNPGKADYICVMKKLLTLLAALSIGISSFAQEKGEIILVVGFPTEMTFENLYYAFYSPDDLYSSYEPQYIRREAMTPVIGVEYTRSVTEKIKLGGAVSWYYANDVLYDPVQDEFLGTRNINNAFVYATAKYCYTKTKKHQFYSGAGLGLGMTLYSQQGMKSSIAPKLAWEIVPIGLTAGEKVYFFVDIALGNMSYATRLGLGYKF